MKEKAAKKALEKAPSWIERILLPSLNEIKGEIKAVNTRIDLLDDRMNTKITALDEKIDGLRSEPSVEAEGLRKEMLSNFEKAGERITSLRNEMKSEFTGMNYRFDAINTRLDSIENRSPVIEKIKALELTVADP
jgi:uncharacterized phage infection (PIP) family protein YhgE